MTKVIFLVGGLLSVAGVVSLIAALEQESHAEAMIPVGSALFSVGILIIAAGVYIGAQKLRSEYQVVALKSKKTDRLCSSCNREPAQVFCRVHVLRLCPECMDQHDDNKNCLYVPARRAAAAFK